MKIQQLKQQVYQLTGTKSTKELKQKKAELVQDKDLRYKTNWIAIYNVLKVINEFGEEQAEKDIKEKYTFKDTSTQSNFSTLIHNIKALEKFANDIDKQFDEIESKFNLGNS